MRLSLEEDMNLDRVAGRGFGCRAGIFFGLGLWACRVPGTPYATLPRVLETPYATPPRLGTKAEPDDGPARAFSQATSTRRRGEFRCRGNSGVTGEFRCRSTFSRIMMN